MANINSDYEFIFTAADARRQRRQAGANNSSVLSWSQIFNPSSYYNRGNTNFGGARSGHNNNKNKYNDLIPEEEEEGSPSSSSGLPLTNLSTSNERSINGVHGGNDGIPPPPEYTLSDAVYERDINGVTSHDLKLNSEPES